jgi:hypothetical protein
MPDEPGKIQPGPSPLTNREGLIGSAQQDQLLQRIQYLEGQVRDLLNRGFGISFYPLRDGSPVPPTKPELGIIFADETNLNHISVKHSDGTVVDLEAGALFPPPLGGANLDHYDYIVDGSYGGSDGDVVVLGSGQSSIMYKTIQAAITAADAANADKTILINGGTYAESVTISATFAHNLSIYGEGIEKVLWGNASTGTALTIAQTSGAWSYRFNNINFRGAISIDGTGASIDSDFFYCKFNAAVRGNFDECMFLHCEFGGGYQVPSGYTPNNVRFIDCGFTGLSTWTGTVTGHIFWGCNWTANADTITSTGNMTGFVAFTNCYIGGTSGRTWFTKNGGSMSALIIDGCNLGSPGTNGIVYIQSVTSGAVLRIVNCRGSANGTNPYVRSDDSDLQFITMGCDWADNGSDAFVGQFKNSVFGPCIPNNYNIQVNTTSSGNTYYGTGAVTGTAATSVHVAKVQVAAGTPSHTAAEGTPYWDSTANILYINNNGSTGWTLIGGLGVSGMGPPGEQGEPGVDGEPGPAGVAGSTGATGSQGPEGRVVPGEDGEDGELLFIQVGPNILPVRSLGLMAASGKPASTTPCNQSIVVEFGTTNLVDFIVLYFPSDTPTSAFWGLKMPPNWDGGPIYFNYVWSVFSGGSGGVVMGLKARAYTNDDAIDQAYGTEVTVADSWIANKDLHESALSTAVTVGGAPKGGQVVQFKLTRKTADGSDDMPISMGLIGVQVFYQTNNWSDK